MNHARLFLCAPLVALLIGTTHAQSQDAVTVFVKIYEMKEGKLKLVSSPTVKTPLDKTARITVRHDHGATTVEVTPGAAKDPDRIFLALEVQTESNGTTRKSIARLEIREGEPTLVGDPLTSFILVGAVRK